MRCVGAAPEELKGLHNAPSPMTYPKHLCEGTPLAAIPQTVAGLAIDLRRTRP